MSIDKLANILGQETVKRIYEDGASHPLQETSKIAVDMVKAFRLLTAPIQLLAAYQDRLSKYFDRVRLSVPEENQIEAPASLSGPIIERLKYLEETNYLTDMYLNLLTRAIDKDRVNEAHPAFFHVIDQLSPDEAMLLYLIGKEPIFYDYDTEIVHQDGQFLRWGNTEIKRDTTAKEKIAFISHFDMYINHLRALNLLEWTKIKEEGIWTEKVQTHTSVKTKIYLNEFGRLFVKACIPENGFIII